MHIVIALAGVGFIAYGYVWSATYMEIAPTFERSLLADIRIGIGVILLALAAISFQLERLSSP